MIKVRRIEIIHACMDGGKNLLFRSRLVNAAALLRIPHASVSEDGNGFAGLAKYPVLHDVLSSF